MFSDSHSEKEYVKLVLNCRAGSYFQALLLGFGRIDAGTLKAGSENHNFCL